MSAEPHIALVEPGTRPELAAIEQAIAAYTMVSRFLGMQSNHTLLLRAVVGDPDDAAVIGGLASFDERLASGSLSSPPIAACDDAPCL
jgi:hypothetical protein